MRSVAIDPSGFNPNINSHKRSSCSCKWICGCRNENIVDDLNGCLTEALLDVPLAPFISGALYKTMCDGTLNKKLIQAMLRDLLYWSIFTDRMEMAKVLLLHLRTRICAALSCAAILQCGARMATTSDQRHFYRQHAKDFEMYATDCINICYSKSERKACELLIRQEPLFGGITCMQVNFSICSLVISKIHLIGGHFIMQ